MQVEMFNFPLITLRENKNLSMRRFRRLISYQGIKKLSFLISSFCACVGLWIFGALVYESREW